MSSLTSFLSQNIGEWKGLRVYREPGKLPYVISTTTTVVDVDLNSPDVVDFVENLKSDHYDINPESAFLISWNSFRDESPYSNGSILSLTEKNLLVRNRGYLMPVVTFCKASFPMDKQMVLETSYGGHLFTEEFTFLDENERSRHTNQYTLDGIFKRAGRYLESRYK